MRKYTLFLLFLPLIIWGTQPPKWLSEIPNSPNEIWGIGQVELSTPDYIKRAEHEALAEIARQIAVHVDAKSYIKLDLHANTEAQHHINLNATNYLEGQQLVGTYQDQQFYYICYKLDKLTYEQKRREKALGIAKQGYDYLLSARQALSSGQLAHAVTYYVQGLQVVEPWLFLELEYNNENIPIALLEGYNSVFEGLTLNISPDKACLPNFSALNFPIVATLMRNDTPIPNFTLAANFIEGNGSITPTVKTDNFGKAILYITQISGKESIQRIRITVSTDITQTLPQTYVTTSSKQIWPECIFSVEVQPQELIAYLHPIGSVIPNCTQQIEALLAKEHFRMTTDEYVATHIIDLSTTISKQGIVAGEIENLEEYLVSLSMKIMDKKTGEIIITYIADGVRVLTKENVPINQLYMLSNKELMRRVRRELPIYLKKIVLTAEQNNNSN